MKTLFGTMNEKGEIVHQIELDINELPSSDPLAFATGIACGQRHAILGESRIIHGAKHSELAQEYLRGFLLGYRGILVPEGTKIKKGQEQSFALYHLNTLKK